MTDHTHTHTCVRRCADTHPRRHTSRATQNTQVPTKARKDKRTKQRQKINNQARAANFATRQRENTTASERASNLQTDSQPSKEIAKAQTKPAANVTDAKKQVGPGKTQTDSIGSSKQVGKQPAERLMHTDFAALRNNTSKKNQTKSKTRPK